MRKRVFLLILTGLMLTGLIAAVNANAESRDDICSCWLTGYDLGIRNTGSDHPQYKSSYMWCDRAGFNSGGAFIQGWRDGKDSRTGLRIPRDCNYYFKNR